MLLIMHMPAAATGPEKAETGAFAFDPPRRVLIEARVVGTVTAGSSLRSDVE